MKRCRTIYLAALLFATSLTGCWGEKESAKDFIKKTQKKYNPKAEVLPPIRKPDIAMYSADELKDPFSSTNPMMNQEILPMVAGGDKSRHTQNLRYAPDFSRKKEFLESFPIDTLSLVGTLRKEDKTWALIKDSKGSIHRVRQGGYIGTNYGEIVNISESNIIIEERIQDDFGGWKKRTHELSIQE